MARATKVTINRRVWGAKVMAGAQMKGFLAGKGAAVASLLPGSRVTITDAPVRGGGRRARARIRLPYSMREEADTGRGQAALRAIVPSAGRTL